MIKERGEKMNNYEVAYAILEIHGYNNVEIQRAVPGKPEQCKMMKNGTGKILLGKESTAEGAIQVASHEVGHFLTYSEGTTNLFKLRRWNYYMGISFAIVILSALGFSLIDNMISNIVLFLFMLGATYVGIKYLSMYEEDELLAEKRGLKELYALQEQKNIYFDMSAVETIVAYRIKKYIVGKVKVMKLFFLTILLTAIFIKVLL